MPYQMSITHYISATVYQAPDLALNIEHDPSAWNSVTDAEDCLSLLPLYMHRTEQNIHDLQKTDDLSHFQNSTWQAA